MELEFWELYDRQSYKWDLKFKDAIRCFDCEWNWHKPVKDWRAYLPWKEREPLLKDMIKKVRIQLIRYDRSIKHIGRRPARPRALAQIKASAVVHVSCATSILSNFTIIVHFSTAGQVAKS